MDNICFNHNIPWASGMKAEISINMGTTGLFLQHELLF